MRSSEQSASIRLLVLISHYYRENSVRSYADC